MSIRTRLVVAFVVLVVGLIAALVIPPGACPNGGRLDEALPHSGDYWCHVSDVGYSASSLIGLKIGVVVVALVAAAILALPVLLRRRSASVVA